MGLFSLFGDVVKMPIFIVEDVLDVVSGETPDNTLSNIKEIIEDVKDTIE